MTWKICGLAGLLAVVTGARERCRARAVTVSWRRFAVEGLVLVPVVVVAAVGALALAG